jgi:hypothetical protein
MTPKIKSHEIPYATIAEFVLQYLKNMKWSIFSYSFPENLSEPSNNLFSRRYFRWKICLLLRLIVSPQLVKVANKLANYSLRHNAVELGGCLK